MALNNDQYKQILREYDERGFRISMTWTSV